MGQASSRQRRQVVALLGASLFDSGWLARLEHISFLGTLDAHPRSRRASNRLEHSIAVAALAADAAASLELRLADARVFVCACLLHDIGHYPQSHAAEGAFAELLGAGHHELGRRIILGEAPIPRARSLRPRLERLGLAPERVWALIEGTPDLEGPLAQLAELLRAPINLDTLEGIPRVARDFGLRRPKLAAKIFCWLPGPEGPELSISAEALPAIDRFWALKDRVYDQVINLPSNILAEARLSALVAAQLGVELSATLEALDDRSLPGLLGDAPLAEVRLRADEDQGYELWTQERYGERVAREDRPKGPPPAPLLLRTRKRYFLDPSVEPGTLGLPLTDWPRRYRHERQQAWLVPRRHDQLSLPLLGRAPGVELRSEAPEI